MQYLLMIYENERILGEMPTADRDAVMGEYFAFTRSLRETGKLLGGNPLKPVATATTVRVRDGRAVVTDGPFAETKEQLGGYYLIEATDLDEARAIAARIPSAKWGSIEVRPIQPVG